MGTWARGILLGVLFSFPFGIWVYASDCASLYAHRSEFRVDAETSHFDLFVQPLGFDSVQSLAGGEQINKTLYRIPLEHPNTRFLAHNGNDFAIIVYRTERITLPMAIEYSSNEGRKIHLSLGKPAYLFRYVIPQFQLRDYRKREDVYVSRRPGYSRFQLEDIRGIDISIPVLPKFTSVAGFHHPWTRAFTKTVANRIEPGMRVLVVGTGGGLEAALIAKLHNVSVDAIDINPFAVANTLAAAKEFGVSHLVRAWTSDMFTEVSGKYDAVLFDIPLATYDTRPAQANLYDPNGALFKRYLDEVADYLTPNGNAYVMTYQTLPYQPSHLESQHLHTFGVYRMQALSVHELWVRD